MSCRIASTLGPLAEQSMRQSLIMSLGTPAIFFERPLSLVFMLLALLLFALPLIKKLLAIRSAAR